MHYNHIVTQIPHDAHMKKYYLHLPPKPMDRFIASSRCIRNGPSKSTPAASRVQETTPDCVRHKTSFQMIQENQNKSKNNTTKAILPLSFFGKKAPHPSRTRVSASASLAVPSAAFGRSKHPASKRLFLGVFIAGEFRRIHPALHVFARRRSGRRRRRPWVRTQKR